MFQITGTCLEFESWIKKPIENQTLVYYKQTAETYFNFELQSKPCILWFLLVWIFRFANMKCKMEVTIDFCYQINFHKILAIEFW